MKPIVFYDFKPDKDDPNNKIVIKKSDLEELLDKTYEAGYQDGQRDQGCSFIRHVQKISKQFQKFRCRKG